VGESLDDEIADLQEIKTTLNRQLLDNIYLTNNGQWMANERVNLSDLLTATPGGVKRIRGDMPIGDALAVVPTPIVIDKILPVVDYWDKVKETRTGIRPGSDLDPDVLKATTKGAFLEHLNRASQKIEMITRLFAETVIKEWVLQAHAILMRHQDRPRMTQLRGKWTPINPREWKERTDLTVRVGLGTGNEEEKRQKLMLLAQMQVQLLQAATVAPPPIYAKGYALFEDMANAMGFETAEKYALAPGGEEYAQMMQQMQAQKGENPELAKEQAKGQVQLQIEQAKAQTQLQAKAAELEVQAANDMRDSEREQVKAQLDAQLEQMKLENQRQIAEMQGGIEKYRADLQSQTQVFLKKLELGVSPEQTEIPMSALADSNAQLVQAIQAIQAQNDISTQRMEQLVQNTSTQMNALVQNMNRPRQVVRGPDGKIVGVQ
jgi:hypothetical protein